MNAQLKQTSTPATSPMMQALTGLTKPLGAVMATSPARRPLPLMEASGLPPFIAHMYRIAPIVPVQPASMVSTAIVPMRKLPLAEAPSVLPGLKPNQPNARMKHPIRTADMSWPRIVLLEPSRLYLPMRGPMINAHGKCCHSSDSVDHARTGEVAIAFAQADVGAQLRQPPGAPSPVAIEWVGDRTHDEGGNGEGERTSNVPRMPR